MDECKSCMFFCLVLLEFCSKQILTVAKSASRSVCQCCAEMFPLFSGVTRDFYFDYKECNFYCNDARRHSILSVVFCCDKCGDFFCRVLLS
jgi:hypothetical protein